MKLFFPPRISADTVPFWDGCKKHRLLIQKCSTCGHLRWPASYLCPECLSEKAEWVEMSGKGTVYSHITMCKAFHPTLKEQVPYVVAEIDLDEGVRLLSNIEDDGTTQIRCGAKVEVVWQDYEEYTKPIFRITGVE